MTQVLDEKIIEEMAKFGVIYGHKKSKTHPRMRPFIAGNRNEIELLDPGATLSGLEKAIDFMKEKMKTGGLGFLVGTSAAAKSDILEFAKEFKFPYVVNRWLGGTLTNFKVINQRTTYYQDLMAKKEKGELSKYTKKEQLEFSEEIGKMSKVFDGLINLSRTPEFLFVVDIKVHETAVREAKKMKIPIVAVLDTDDNIDLVEYPILANDHGKSSISWVIEKVREGLKKV